MAKKKKYLRSRAIKELQDENIVYYLADNPVYLHNNREYYDVGLKTATKILNERLKQVVDTVHCQIPALRAILDNKINNIVQSCKFKTWEEFKQWWENDIMGYPVENDGTAIYYLSLLNKIKQQATLIGIYTSARRGSRKTGELTEAGKRRLVDLGFMSVDFLTRESTRATDQDAITAIKKTQRQDLKDLEQYVGKHFATAQDSYIQKAYKDIQNVVASGNVETSLATAIGRLEEGITAMVEKQGLNGIKAIMKNVSAEKSGGEFNSKEYKADSKITLINGEATVSFLASDKTGMRAAFGEDGRIIGTIDTFTAGLNVTNVEDIAKNMETSVDLAAIDPKLGNLFAYILKNANAFNLQVQEQKEIIVSFFAWAKLMTEFVGSLKSPDTMPPVIKMFNRLYKTSDVMQRFTNVNGVQILQYVNKTYLNDFYKVYHDKGKINKPKLKRAKKKALGDLTKINQISYKNLKAAIHNVLTGMSNSVITQKISTSYSIMMDNIQNLK